MIYMQNVLEKQFLDKYYACENEFWSLLNHFLYGLHAQIPAGLTTFPKRSLC